MNYDDTPHEPTGPVEDDRLRPLFSCSRPRARTRGADRADARLLGGPTVIQIAQVFLVPATTMAQRITRARRIAPATGALPVPEA